MIALVVAIATPLVLLPALIAIGGALHDANIHRQRRKRDRIRRARLGLARELPR